jgi:hypothetical protein
MLLLMDYAGLCRYDAIAWEDGHDYLLISASERERGMRRADGAQWWILPRSR